MALSLFFKSIGEFKLSLGRQICISYKVPCTMAIYSDCNKYTSMLDYLINWNLWKNRLRRI